MLVVCRRRKAAVVALLSIGLALGLLAETGLLSPAAHAQTTPRAQTIRQLDRRLGALSKQLKKQAAQLVTLTKGQKKLTASAAKKSSLSYRDGWILLLFSLVLLVPIALVLVDLVASGRRLDKLKGSARFRASDLKEIARGTPGLARYSMAALIFVILGWIVAYLFISGKNVEVAKSIATTLAGLLASIVGFYFGSKTKQEAPQASSAATKGLAVVSTVPVDGAQAISRDPGVRVSFNQAVDPNSVTDTSFVLFDASGQEVAARVAYVASTWSAILVPQASLAAKADHTAKLTTDIKAADGTALPEPHSWGFTTGP